MARIVVAGAGAIGASIAYHLGAARREATSCLPTAREIASGSTGKAMGGVRQQFSTAAEVRLARESIAFFEELGPPFFEQVGYLFFATTSRASPSSRSARSCSAARGCRSRASTRRASRG